MKDNPESWKNVPPEVYNICWLKGTEAPFSGQYNKNYEDGTYFCACCENPLFSSHAKYDSGSGWPSFWESKNPDSLLRQTDTSLGMTRIEVLCGNCGAHLGHEFEDGPLPTGKRLCINSLALHFQAKK